MEINRNNAKRVMSISRNLRRSRRYLVLAQSESEQDSKLRQNVDDAIQKVDESLDLLEG